MLGATSIETYCPECKRLHVDDGPWATTPHRTHVCLSCARRGRVVSWTPEDKPTVGRAANDLHRPNFEERLCQIFLPRNYASNPGRFDIKKNVDGHTQVYLRRIRLWDPGKTICGGGPLSGWDEVLGVLHRTLTGLEVGDDVREAAIQLAERTKAEGTRLYLHSIKLPDNDRNKHNHPASFEALTLTGGYDELLAEGLVPRPAGQSRRQAGEVFHQVLNVKPGTWTLFACERPRRVWEFESDDGPVNWRTYLGPDDPNENEFNDPDSFAEVVV